MTWTHSSRSGNSSGVSLMSTDLNSLAAAGRVLSSVGGSSGVISNDTEKDQLVDLLLSVDFVSAPTADTPISVWFLPKIDGTNYEDGDASNTPNRPPDGIFAVRNTASAMKLSALGLRLPPRDFKILLINGTNQAFPSSGTTLVGFFYN